MTMNKRPIPHCSRYPLCCVRSRVRRVTSCEARPTKSAIYIRIYAQARRISFPATPTRLAFYCFGTRTRYSLETLKSPAVRGSLWDWLGRYWTGWRLFGELKYLLQGQSSRGPAGNHSDSAITCTRPLNCTYSFFGTTNLLDPVHIAAPSDCPTIY